MRFATLIKVLSGRKTARLVLMSCYRMRANEGKCNQSAAFAKIVETLLSKRFLPISFAIFFAGSPLGLFKSTATKSLSSFQKKE